MIDSLIMECADLGNTGVLLSQTQIKDIFNALNRYKRWHVKEDRYR
jgi:hypothetical protein